jgi:hypothetical protein
MVAATNPAAHVSVTDVQESDAGVSVAVVCSVRADSGIEPPAGLLLRPGGLVWLAEETRPSAPVLECAAAALAARWATQPLLAAETRAGSTLARLVPESALPAKKLFLLGGGHDF